MKENKKVYWIVYIQIILAVWAVLFGCSMAVDSGGLLSAILAVGCYAFLFVNIPLSIVCLILRANGYFREKYTVLSILLSVLNIVISLVVWFYLAVILFMLIAAFG